MRFVSIFKILAKAYCVWATCSLAALAQDASMTREHGPWIESKPFLKEERPSVPDTTIPFVAMMKEALVKGLNNLDHHRAVLKMQAEQGTKAQSFGEGYLGPQKSLSNYDANATHGTRWTLFKNIKTFSGKEIRVDFVPESIKAGFRFDQSAPAAGAPVMVTNGTPVTYGLILTNIEPSRDVLRIAAIGSEADYRFFQNAPKAKLEYTVGPISLEPVAAHPYAVVPAPQSTSQFNWRSLLPDHRFRGKFSPKGMPTAAKPLPDQTLMIEQVQGYYSSDIQFVDGFHKESVTHRFRLPIYDRFTLHEEFNEAFKPTKVVFTDFLSRGGFSTNLEHFLLERRYRAGFLYRKHLLNAELFLNLPDNALNSRFSREQRWELNFFMAI